MLSKILVGVAGMEKRGKGKYYPRPSMAGTERCIRQMTYHSRGFKEDTQMGDRFVIVLDDSSFHEDLTADWMQKTAFQLNSQQMAVTALNMDITPGIETVKCRVCGEEHLVDELHGHIDGVITDLLQVDRLWEHKAINHFTFERYWKGTWPLDYITQCCLYVLGLQKVNPNINEAVLLIKNKNTSQYMDMVIRYDAEMDEAHIVEVERSSGEVISMKETPIITFKDIVGNAVDKFRKVHEHTQAGTLPDRPFEVGTDYPCTYCSWQETCWEEYELEYERLTEDKALEQEWYETCKYYLEVAMHKKSSEAEYDELRKTILLTLKGEGAKSGRIGPYIVKIMQRKSAKGISEWVQIKMAKKGRK